MAEFNLDIFRGQLQTGFSTRKELQGALDINGDGKINSTDYGLFSQARAEIEKDTKNPFTTIKVNNEDYNIITGQNQHRTHGTRKKDFIFTDHVDSVRGRGGNDMIFAIGAERVRDRFGDNYISAEKCPNIKAKGSITNISPSVTQPQIEEKKQVVENEEKENVVVSNPQQETTPPPKKDEKVSSQEGKTDKYTVQPEDNAGRIIQKWLDAMSPEEQKEALKNKSKEDYVKEFRVTNKDKFVTNKEGKSYLLAGDDSIILPKAVSLKALTENGMQDKKVVDEQWTKSHKKPATPTAPASAPAPAATATTPAPAPAPAPAKTTPAANPESAAYVDERIAELEKLGGYGNEIAKLREAKTDPEKMKQIIKDRLALLKNPGYQAKAEHNNKESYQNELNKLNKMQADFKKEDADNKQKDATATPAAKPIEFAAFADARKAELEKCGGNEKQIAELMEAKTDPAKRDEYINAQINDLTKKLDWKNRIFLKDYSNEEKQLAELQEYQKLAKNG